MDEGADEQGAENGGVAGEASAPHPVSEAAPVRRKKSRLWLKVVAIIVAVPVLLFAGWTLITLSWVYSRGDRAGYIQKFSQKGWVCKTWEGDLAMSNIPGSTPEHFLFTVRDDSVAHAITQLMGSRVALSYDEHRGVPGSCFGETGYYVTSAKAVAGP